MHGESQVVLSGLGKAIHRKESVPSWIRPRLVVILLTMKRDREGRAPDTVGCVGGFIFSASMTGGAGSSSEEFVRAPSSPKYNGQSRPSPWRTP